ncbi:LacI family DNA-binding transcriptional regulator [Piscinibacter gummiphilus]|uniref:GntR family transcriptional regulator n=1 Tax=Piscinibacter gummiphilus TaxID=946333 RepID=A0A1W6L4X4_9BURK|nr:LacI family DNA-binding transcriptional regulator [Piscinibacter gummiphilus]ARN19365.1 GntR family transcriptional regulator [Piscinibacter gummiphilus]ATU64032.1 GntR family transcriptional regulator [Piscinibacter gummiphilus]GLS93007.1 LacI family transcriptional regulator [Piscinibacter gummiphilus]
MNASRPFKTPTLADVARVAGVSPITASRALANPGLVSEKTIARVREAVEATGYIPNMLAGGLKSTRSMTVACLVPAISVAQFLPTVQALTDALAAAGYQLVLGQTGYDHAREDALIDTMVARRPDGIVVAGLVHSTAARQKLHRLGIPLVETWDLTEQPIDMLVGFSHQQVGAAVAAFFRRKGWERVGIATGDDHRASLRRQGFTGAWGREVPVAVGPAPSNMALGRQALSRLIEQEPRLQAVYCSSDQLAQGVVTEALSRGLRVPEDLAVCGFGDAAFASQMEPSLTTVQVDGAAIGERAAALIIGRCKGEDVGESVTDVGFRIVERASTG